MAQSAGGFTDVEVLRMRVSERKIMFENERPVREQVEAENETLKASLTSSRASLERINVQTAAAEVARISPIPSEHYATKLADKATRMTFRTLLRPHGWRAPQMMSGSFGVGLGSLVGLDDRCTPRC